ncbi:hypothetical protein, partial [Kitasatospora sp. NPDC096140]|uniref:hypothetical protein n=1 Tax=Kitasatospora sp. NPDC096140 TaxID=3155425 RepID=UPI0033334103
MRAVPAAVGGGRRPRFRPGGVADKASACPGSVPSRHGGREVRRGKSALAVVAALCVALLPYVTAAHYGLN